MDWFEQQTETKETGKASASRAAELEASKKSGLPMIKKEVANGAPVFDPIQYQPVKSPGIYEAEFGMKGDDLIFHFWPYGYHQADRDEKPLPAFKREFHLVLRRVMGETFGPHRIVVDEDRDMGAWYVQATGWGTNQFCRELAIKACEAIHKSLGGN